MGNPPPMDDLSRYDYELPTELIADQPLDRRDASRLLIVDRTSGELRHRTVTDLPDLLRPGDCLVLNDTKVLPARLLGERTATGGRWEGLYLGSTPSGNWKLIGQTRGQLRPGERITIRPAHHPASGEELYITLLESQPDGVWLAEPDSPEDAVTLLARFGTVPLPHYIRRTRSSPCPPCEGEPQGGGGHNPGVADPPQSPLRQGGGNEVREIDWQRYQTSFARRPGAVAAPTAGFHFTPELLARCRERGIRQAFVTLHVGLGTFRPITVERLSRHRMHAEWCELPAETADTLNRTRQDGGRIVAVGTTTVRTLESVAQSGPLQEWRGETKLFIRPPYEFRATDALLTNFHLPRSTLLVLVCAFAGTDFTKRTYAAAVQQRYRFYSYGDAMLIV